MSLPSPLQATGFAPIATPRDIRTALDGVRIGATVVVEVRRPNAPYRATVPVTGFTYPRVRLEEMPSATATQRSVGTGGSTPLPEPRAKGAEGAEGASKFSAFSASSALSASRHFIYFQFRGFPSAIHSTAVAMRRARVSSLLAVVTHST